MLYVYGIVNTDKGIIDVKQNRITKKLSYVRKETDKTLLKILDDEIQKFKSTFKKK